MTTKCDPPRTPPARKSREQRREEIHTENEQFVRAMLTPANKDAEGKAITGKATLDITGKTPQVNGKSLLLGFGMKVTKPPTGGKISGEVFSGELPPALRWPVEVKDGKLQRIGGDPVGENISHVSVGGDGRTWVHRESDDHREVTWEGMGNPEISGDEVAYHPAVKALRREHHRHELTLLALADHSDQSAREAIRTSLRMGSRDPAAQAERREAARRTLVGKRVLMQPGEPTVQQGSWGVSSDAIPLQKDGNAGGQPLHTVEADVAVELRGLFFRPGQRVVGGRVASVGRELPPDAIEMGLDAEKGLAALGAPLAGGRAAWVLNGRIFLQFPDVVKGPTEAVGAQAAAGDGGKGKPPTDQEVSEANDDGVTPPAAAPVKVKDRRPEKQRNDLYYALGQTFIRPSRLFRDRSNGRDPVGSLMADAVEGASRAATARGRRFRHFEEGREPIVKAWKRLSEADQLAFGDLIAHFSENQIDPTHSLAVEYLMTNRRLVGGQAAADRLARLYMRMSDWLVNTVGKAIDDHNESMKADAQRRVEEVWIPFISDAAETEKEGDAERIVRNWIALLRARMRHDQRQHAAHRERLEEAKRLGQDPPREEITEYPASKKEKRDEWEARAFFDKLIMQAQGSERQQMENAIALLRRDVRRLDNQPIRNKRRGYFPSRMYAEYSVFRIEIDVETGSVDRTQLVPEDTLLGGFNTVEEAHEEIEKDAERVRNFGAYFEYEIRSRGYGRSPKDDLSILPGFSDRLNREINLAIRQKLREQPNLKKEIRKVLRQVREQFREVEGLAVSLSDVRSGLLSTGARQRLRRKLAGEDVKRTLNAARAKYFSPGWSRDVAQVLGDHAISVNRGLFLDEMQWLAAPAAHLEGGTLDSDAGRNWRLRTFQSWYRDNLGGTGYFGNMVDAYGEANLLRFARPGGFMDIVLKTALLRMSVGGLIPAAAFFSVGWNPAIPIIWQALRGGMHGVRAAREYRGVRSRERYPSYSRAIANAEAGLEASWKLTALPWTLTFPIQNLTQMANIPSRAGTMNTIMGFWRVVQMGLPGTKNSAHSERLRKLFDEVIDQGQHHFEASFDVETRRRLLGLLGFGWLAENSELLNRRVAVAAGVEAAKKLGLDREEDIERQLIPLRKERDQTRKLAASLQESADRKMAEAKVAIEKAAQATEAMREALKVVRELEAKATARAKQAAGYKTEKARENAEAEAEDLRQEAAEAAAKHEQRAAKAAELNARAVAVAGMNKAEADALREDAAVQDRHADDLDAEISLIWSRRKDITSEEAAARIVMITTQFDYKLANRPGPLRKRLYMASNTLQFRNFPAQFFANVIEMFLRPKPAQQTMLYGKPSNQTTRSERGRAIAMLVFYWLVTGGARMSLGGAALSYVVYGIMALLAALEDEDDEQIEQSAQLMNLMDGIRQSDPSKVATAFNYGASNLFGIALGSSVGQRDLMPFVAGGIHPGASWTEFLGPGLSADYRGTRALARNYKGPWKAGEIAVGATMPGVAKTIQAAKGFGLFGREHKGVYYTNLGEKLFDDATNWDLGLLLGGLRSTRVGLNYERQQAVYRSGTIDRDRMLGQSRVEIQKAIYRDDWDTVVRVATALSWVGVDPGDPRPRVDVSSWLTGIAWDVKAEDALRMREIALMHRELQPR